MERLSFTRFMSEAYQQILARTKPRRLGAVGIL